MQNPPFYGYQNEKNYQHMGSSGQPNMGMNFNQNMAVQQYSTNTQPCLQQVTSMQAPNNIPMGMPSIPSIPAMQPQYTQPMTMPNIPQMGFPGQGTMNPPIGTNPSLNANPQGNIPGQSMMGIPGQAPVVPPMGMPGQPPLIPAMGMPGPPGMNDMQQKQQRLDPELMPSAIQVREDDKIAKNGPFPTGYPVADIPPLITTDYIGQDQGNCIPRFLRSTLYSVPTTNDMLKISHMPFVISCTPFAKVMANEYSPPIVNLGDIGPIRCQRCRAYMCPFMQFIDGGRKFKCPICNSSTPVCDEYFAHLDHTGRRIDISSRPEFCLGSYEFVATTAYCRDNIFPKEPVFIFMLDVSYNSIKSGLVQTISSNLKNLLSMLPKETYQNKSTLRVAFATYDNTLHFYNLSSKCQKPEMTIVTDIEDPFVPFIDGLLVDVSEAEESIQMILNEIPKLFQDTKITTSCLGPVIQAGLDVLKSSNRVGKIFVFHTNLPTMEAPGKLVNRDDRKVLGGEKEKTVLSPNGDFYTKLGEECSKNGVCVDLFLFPNSYIDVASISPLVSISGGHLYKYQYYDSTKDEKNFISDFKNAISCEIAFDAIIRIRTSTGLRPVNFYGHFLMQNSTDMEFGCLDPYKEVLAEIKYDDKLPENEPCYIQAAILYTSVSGQRRVRIHNLSLTTTTDFQNLYKFIEPDTFISYLYKYGERIVKERSIKDMKEQLIDMCAHILATYREKCSENSPMGQLILPEVLRLLPLYLGCIIKNDGLTGNSDLTVDDRAWLMQIIPGLRTEEVITLLYPKIYKVTDITYEDIEEDLIIPSEVRASFNLLKSTDAYIISNGFKIFLWIGQDVPSDWIENIFNLQHQKYINTENSHIPERDNSHSRGLRKIIEIMNKQLIRHSNILIIRQNDPLESWMKRFLVEDRYAGQTGSYVDSLCILHREIRAILS
uniref:Protein transport protein Sec24C n=1 Tax=Parastrongyloides trichosuri TaxID=131310 RepID=A0A0N4ZSD2_PARTI